MKYTHLLVGLGAALLISGSIASSAVAEATPSCGVLPQSICDASANDGQTNMNDSGVFQIVLWVLRVMTGLVGVAAVGALIYAGIMYASASGQSAQITKAKTIITDVVIGLVAYGFMAIILNWLIPGGIFGS
jgi:hypothetical protein